MILRTIRILDEELRLYGVTESGRRFVTSGGDFILRPVCNADGSRFPPLPDDQDPIEVRQRDFYPWRRIPITEEDMSEIHRRTAAYREAKLKEYAEQEKKVKRKRLKDFITEYGPRNHEEPWTDVQAAAKMKDWKTTELRAIAELKQPYEGGHSYAGLPLDYTTDHWIRDYGDDLRRAKWERANGKSGWQSEDTMALELNMKLGCCLDAECPSGVPVLSRSDIPHLIDRIRLEVTYPRTIVFLEGIDNVLPNSESIALINQFKIRNPEMGPSPVVTPAADNSMPASASATVLPPPTETEPKAIVSVAEWHSPDYRLIFLSDDEGKIESIRLPRTVAQILRALDSAPHRSLTKGSLRTAVFSQEAKQSGEFRPEKVILRFKHAKKISPRLVKWHDGVFTLNIPQGPQGPK